MKKISTWFLKLLLKHRAIVFQYAFIAILVIIFLIVGTAPKTENKTTKNPPKTQTFEKVSINKASQKVLENVSGIGSSLALKIINNRPYKTLEDLLNKKVISNSLFEKIKSKIEI